MALPTAVAVRTAHFPHLSGTGVDTVLDGLIAEADAALAGWCGFPVATAGVAPTLESTTYIQFLDGPSAQSSRRLDLCPRPVASVTSIHDDRDRDWTYGAADLVASGDYTLDAIAGQVFLHSDATHGGWSSGPIGSRFLRVEFVAGYDTGAHFTIRRGIGALVKHWYELRQTQSQVSATVQGNTEAHRPETIPEHVQQIMWPIRLVEVEFG